MKRRREGKSMKSMKKKYETPSALLYSVSPEDILTASVGDDELAGGMGSSGINTPLIDLDESGTWRN